MTTKHAAKQQTDNMNGATGPSCKVSASKLAKIPAAIAINPLADVDVAKVWAVKAASNFSTPMCCLTYQLSKTLKRSDVETPPKTRPKSKIQKLLANLMKQHTL